MEALIQHEKQVKAWHHEIGLNPDGIVREPIRLVHSPINCWVYTYWRYGPHKERYPEQVRVSPEQVVSAALHLNPIVRGACDH